MSEAVRSKVERHAANLENAAKSMSADGIGLDNLRGHASILRRMASAMRQDAAQGRLPHSYSDNAAMYASAGASLPGPVLHDLRAAGLESLAQDGESISITDLDASFAETGTDAGTRIRLKQWAAGAGKLTA
jgi:hypothetical protein